MKTDGDKYLVSAIVSTYNAEKYIAGCLEDLVNQTIADRIEIIVVNSGSQQNEDAIIKEFQRKYDNIRYIKTEQRETIYAAWNRAIKISSGKYITNANTDDRHRKDALMIMAQALDENPDKVLVYANQNIVKPHEGRNILVGEGVYGYYLRQRLLSRELDVGSQPLWRRMLHDEFGYFDESFFVAGDTEFWLRISQKYDFMYLNKILGERLFRPDGVWLSEKDGICEIEKMILLSCFNYALEKHLVVDHLGISGSPIFSRWCEVNLWKQRVQDKISNKKTEPHDNIRTFSDLRTNKNPGLTIIIVTCGRLDSLNENIKSLSEQTGHEFEVVIVNNGESISRPEEIAGRLSQGICYIETKQDLGTSLSRNLAVSYSKADYIAFLDENAVARNDYAKNILKRFGDNSICGMRGRILPKVSGPALIPYDLSDEAIPAACDIAGISAFRKDIFLGMGGFNPNLFYYEGSELSYRIYKSRDSDTDCIMYFPDVMAFMDYSKKGDQVREDNIRRIITEKMQREPEFVRYLQFMDGFYSQKRYDCTYRKFISWFKLYENKNPERALEYIKKAIDVNPSEYLGYYYLGVLYVKLNKAHQARIMLEKTIGMLEHIMSAESDKLLAIRNISEINECYVSSSTKLASILVSIGKFDEAAEMLTKLVNNNMFRIPPKQELEVRQWLDKFRNISIKER